MGNYSDDDIIRTLAFRVLAHAEIEAFVEERAWATVTKAIEVWTKHGRTGRTLAALLAFSTSHGGEPPTTLEPSQPSQKKTWPDRVDIDRRIANAANAYWHVKNGNHGVKEANLMALLLPIGVNLTSLDATMLMDLSAFGEARGDAAHNSGASVKAPPDPQGELKRVETLLQHLVAIDACFSDLQAEVVSARAAIT
jgi:hypothetical protein